MVVEDTTAFIEEIEFPRISRKQRKYRRRLAEAELELLRAQHEVRLASEALDRMERTRARGVELESAQTRRRRFRDRSLEGETARVRAHLAATRQHLAVTQKRVISVRERSRNHDASRPSAAIFRLHSANHHLDCSAARFARLSASQRELPILVAKGGGRQWWWYLDRFWWDHDGLAAAEVQDIVLQADFHRKQQSDAVARARTVVLGAGGVPLQTDHVSEQVRLAVWCRDRGRCVDCGSREAIAFDPIVSFSDGGSDTPANVELRCQSCRVRLAHNEMRKTVISARVDAAPHYRTERVSA
jgi:hypothetical protein